MSNKSYSPLHRVSLTAVSIAAASFLSACGGGGSDGTAAATATATDVGTLSIDVTDGPATALDNVYITVKEVWFHHSDSALHADADWKKFPLTTPVTIDMNKLSNGALAKAFDGIKLPVGTYKQIRLFLADSTEPWVDTAKTAGLLFNDQVNYTDPKGAKKSAALELASAEKGIALNGSFDIAKGKTLRLAVEFNVGDDVVRFTHNNADAFKLQPNLRYFDLDNAAAIGGSIDRTACSALANPCRDIIVKLEEPSADGSVHRVTRWTSVKADGSFMLYPVPASKGKTYDMVITGRNAQPMIIKGIPAVGGSTPQSSEQNLRGLIKHAITAKGRYLG